MHDMETYQQRQSVLDELDVLRQREASLKRQEEMNRREQQLWDEKIKSREALSKRKEEAARRIEVEYEQKIRDEINKYVNNLQLGGGGGLVSQILLHIHVHQVLWLD